MRGGKRIAAALGAFAFITFAAFFIAWDFNPAHWTVAGRYFVIAFATGAAILTYTYPGWEHK